MTTTRRPPGPLAALVLALALTVSGALVAVGPALPGPAAYAGSAPACTVPDINVHKGRLEGAAGTRYLNVRAVNESNHACTTPGWTRYRFTNAGGVIGHRSHRNPGYDPNAARVVIGASATARSVLSWTDPGPVPKSQCHAKHATGVLVKIRGLPGHYRLHVDARVCTTWKYRPHGTRLHT